MTTTDTAGKDSAVHTATGKSLNQMWLRLMLYAPWALAGTLVLMAGRMAIQFAPALVIRALFDKLTAEAALTPELWALVALLIGVALARVVILVSATWAHSTMSYLYTSLLNTNILDYLTRRPGALALPFPPGNLVNRVSGDVPQVGVVLNFMLLEGVGFFTAAIAVYWMARIDPWVTLVALAPLAAAAIITQRVTHRFERLQQARRAVDGTVSTFLGEVFGAVQAIQVAGATTHAARRLEELNYTRRHAVLQQRMFQDVIMGSLLNNISHVATGVFLLLAAGRMRAGLFSIGDFALFTYFLPVLSDFVMGIGMAVAHYKQADVSSQRLHEVIDQPPAESTAIMTAYHPLNLNKVETAPVELAPAPPLASFAVQKLSYRHPSTGRGVQDASFALKPGTVTVLTGRVGSGKSTLLAALLGLLPAQSGQVLWNNMPVENPADFFVPLRASFVPQTPRLYSASLQENVLLERAPIYLQPALHTAVLEDDIATFPEGLATVVGPRGMRLSGGQVQRAAAARALVGQPTLLVFDDLSSALDVATEATLWQRLRALEQTTILAVSTRHITFHQADQIIVLKEGRFEAAGTLAALLESSAEMRYLYHAAEHQPQA